MPIANEGEIMPLSSVDRLQGRAFFHLKNLKSIAQEVLEVLFDITD